METVELKSRAFETLNVLVESATYLSPRNRGLTFKLPEGQSFKFNAGQFVQAFIPLDDGKFKRTAYSIASSPVQGNRFELCITKVDGGPSSTFLHSVNVGDYLKIMGPFGKFGLPTNIQRDMVFIATGSGIAPLRSMIHYLLAKPTKSKIYLLFGNRHDDDVLYKSEWELLSKIHANFIPKMTLSQPSVAWKGLTGYVQENVEKAIPDIPMKDYYLCGLKSMISSVQEKLLSLGVPLDQIYFERYD